MINKNELQAPADKLRVLQEHVGASDYDIVVDFTSKRNDSIFKKIESTGKTKLLKKLTFKIHLSDEKVIKTNLDDLASMKFFDQIVDYLGLVQRQSKFSYSDAFNALTAVMSCAKRTKNDLLMKNVFCDSISNCALRTFTGRINSTGFEQSTRIYSSVVIKAFYEVQTRLFHSSKSSDAKTNMWQQILKKGGFSDIIVFDGFVNQVTPAASKHCHVKGNGNYKSVHRKGDRREYSSSKTCHVKGHLAISAITKALFYCDITEGVDAEHRHVHYDALADANPGIGKVIYVADRANYCIKNTKKIKKKNVMFCIRGRETINNRVHRIYDKDGNTLAMPTANLSDTTQPSSLKVKSPFIRKLVNELEILDCVTTGQTYVEVKTATEEELKMCCPPSRPNQKQRLCYGGTHRVVIVRGLPNKSGVYGSPMYLLTNIPRDVLSPEDIVELYKARWEIEISIKALRQGNSMQATHAKRISFALSTMYCSFSQYAIKTYLSMLDNSTVPQDISHEDMTHIYEYSLSAESGIARRYLAIERAVHYFMNRRKGSDAVATYNKRAITTKGVFAPDIREYKSETHCKKEKWSTNPLVLALQSEADARLALINCSTTEMKSILRSATADTTDTYSAKLIVDFQDFLNEHGIKAEIVEVLEQIRAKAKEIGVDIHNAITRPKELHAVSLLQLHNNSSINKLIYGLYDYELEDGSTANLRNGQRAGRRLSEIVDDATNLIRKHCKAAHICLKSYENRNDYRILLSSNIVRNT